LFSRRAGTAAPGRFGGLITVAFGFRNLANYEAGLREMRRAPPGGMAAILEFSQPPNRASRHCTNSTAAYSPGHRRRADGIEDAYAYLPESVRKFPEAGELAAEMRRVGFGTCVSSG
jgi:demethylmenaquinone methyltransferase/2-methoxy-6-polyprenyl-1,4-benzoquinol methylase